MNRCEARIAAAVLLSVAGVTAACGQKGPPLPPLRPAPAAVSDLTVERDADKLTLRFTIPATNRDGSTPVAIDRVEIYALSTLEGAPAPTRLQLSTSGNLATTIAVRPPDAPAPAAGAPADTRLTPGAAATFVETRSPDGSTAAARHYAAVGYTGRRRGAESAVVSVPLLRVPPPPGPLVFDHDEKTLKVTWTAPAAALAYRLYEVTSGPPPAMTLLNATLLSTPEFTLPVDLGREKCFALRTIEAAGRVTLTGSLGEPQCVTPADKYPPAAPTRLIAQPVEGGVDLVWSVSESPDVAGYRVLRGEGANALLQQLAKELVTTPAFRDTTTKSGVTYVYSVIAVDKTGNESEQSNRQEATARLYSLARRTEITEKN